MYTLLESAVHDEKALTCKMTTYLTTRTKLPVGLFFFNSTQLVHKITNTTITKKELLKALSGRGNYYTNITLLECLPGFRNTQVIELIHLYKVNAFQQT